MKEVTWKSPSNIALVKYWGKYPVQLPANPSISFTLSAAATTTTLKYKQGTGQVVVFLEGEEAPSFLPKIHTFLERTQELFPFTREWDFEVHTSNSFPHSSGIASSASGMSALSLCLMSVKEALGITITDFFEEASEAARLGSGSGSRSLYGPMAAWEHMRTHLEVTIDLLLLTTILTPYLNRFKTLFYWWTRERKK